MQGTPVLRGRAPGDDLADPAFQRDQALVPGGKRARGHQHRPQVDEGAAWRQRVERLVSDGAVACDGLERLLRNRDHHGAPERIVTLGHRVTIFVPEPVPNVP